MEIANGVPSEYEAALDMPRSEIERALDIQEKNKMISMLGSGFCDDKSAKKLKRKIHEIEENVLPATHGKKELTRDDRKLLKSVGL